MRLAQMTPTEKQKAKEREEIDDFKGNMAETQNELHVTISASVFLKARLDKVCEKNAKE